MSHFKGNKEVLEGGIEPGIELGRHQQQLSPGWLLGDQGCHICWQLHTQLDF